MGEAEPKDFPVLTREEMDALRNAAAEER